MKLGDLVRFYEYPENGYGVVIKVTPYGVHVCWDNGEVSSIWKKNLEVINENR